MPNNDEVEMNMKALLMIALAAVGAAAPAAVAAEATEKPLIVYLSRTQNTAAVARMIQQQTGGDLAELDTQTPYPQNYRAAVEQVRRENERGYLPPLKPLARDVRAYRTIYLGFPTWSMQLPPPVKSWLSRTDLRGKTVIPFNTYGGYGVGSGFDDVKRLCTGCTVLTGLSVKGGSERDGVKLAIRGAQAQTVNRQVRAWRDGLPR